VRVRGKCKKWRNPLGWGHDDSFDTHTHTHTHTGSIGDCPALEWAILDFKLDATRYPRWPGQMVASSDAVRRLLSSSPRLFYVLIRDEHWDLTGLPAGWEVHPIAEEAEPGERPLILEPTGIFSRPLEVHCDAESRLLVLFHPARSPVRLGEDNAAWRWLLPKRPIRVILLDPSDGSGDDE
jgi:hypothetical protein